jgi:outer membrane protein OmpA-like peptidoglycan-associated protein
MTSSHQSGLWAGVVLSAWAAGCLASPAAAEPAFVKSWQVAQAPGRAEAGEEDEKRRKGRDERRNQQQERRDDSRRSDPRQDAQPSNRPAVAPQERRQAPGRQEARPEQQVPPRREAQPPARPAIINERRAGEGDSARDELRAKQKEMLDKRRDVRDERQEDRRDARDARQERKEDRKDDRRDARQERQEDRRDARDARQEPKEDRKDDRRDARQERQEDRRDTRDARQERKEDRRDDRRDARQERQEDRRDARADRKDDRAERRVHRLEDLKQLRRQRVEDGGKRTVIEEPGNRTIVREQGRTIIRHDETERFRRRFKDTRVDRRRDGSTETVFIRPDGVHVVSVTDSRGRLLHRYRRHRDGRTVVLIDNRRYHRPGFVEGLFLGAVLDLRPPVVRIPREKYIVEYEDASYDDVYEALAAPPVDELERRYSLDEIRYNRYLRERMRRIDLDSINFEFGSWEVPADQYHKLERIAKAIDRLLERNPDEIIMIEGHTDAVGSDEDNLTLSDRRAETVAEILSEEFEIPPENLITQGYGEQFLKIETQAPERANRRVAMRRITPLLSRSED